jgi:hypothetical protein
VAGGRQYRRALSWLDRPGTDSDDDSGAADAGINVEDHSIRFELGYVGQLCILPTVQFKDGRRIERCTLAVEKWRMQRGSILMKEVSWYCCRNLVSRVDAPRSGE